jgi:MFS superfamily sulfate permease-like transporter
VIASVRRPGIARAAVTTAIAWLALGAALTLLVSTAPHPGALIPRLLSALVIVIGWPLGRWAGRRNGLRARGEWARMWAATVAVIWLAFGFVGCAAALVMYG